MAVAPHHLCLCTTRGVPMAQLGSSWCGVGGRGRLLRAPGDALLCVVPYSCATNFNVGLCSPACLAWMLSCQSTGVLPLSSSPRGRNASPKHQLAARSVEVKAPNNGVVCEIINGKFYHITFSRRETAQGKPKALIVLYVQIGEPT